ncbi:MAG: ATP-binding protein [Candidatus Eisenbacteria bacterium]
MPRPRLTIAVRLTLWYAAAFAFSSLLAMALVYGTVFAVLHQRADRELISDLEELVEMVDAGGAAAFHAELVRERDGPDSTIAHMRLWSPGLKPVESLGFPRPDAATLRLVHAQRERDEVTLRSLPRAAPGAEVRAACGRSAAGFVIELGQSLQEVEALLAALRNGILLALPTVLLLGGPIGWFMARRALRGVEVVTQTALRIAGGAIDERVPVGSHGDELDRLALAFNGMLDRIAQLIAGMREVTDDLAHDLRTPLARMRASAERAAARGAGTEEWLTLAGTTTEECDRLLQILNSTLEIAEARAGATPLALEDVDLAELAEEARDLFATLAEDAGIALELGAPARCMVRADRARVQRIVANLLDNALKFTPAGGRIAMRVADQGAWVALDVQDTGIGIAADKLPRVFERFYRADGSRTGHGSGLGLSLAQAFARAHGGDLTAVSTPGAGRVFTLRLRRDTA